MTGPEKNQLDDARRVERLFDAYHFDELLAFAEEVCLQKPSQPEKSAVPLEGERAVVAKVGISGLRAALDYKLGDEASYSVDPEMDDGFTFNATTASPDSPIRHPEAFSAGLDHEQSARVEAFGAQLMRESWKVLGRVAHQHDVLIGHCVRGGWSYRTHTGPASPFSLQKHLTAYAMSNLSLAVVSFGSHRYCLNTVIMTKY